MTGRAETAVVGAGLVVVLAVVAGRVVLVVLVLVVVEVVVEVDVLDVVPRAKTASSPTAPEQPVSSDIANPNVRRRPATSLFQTQPVRDRRTDLSSWPRCSPGRC